MKEENMHTFDRLKQKRKQDKMPDKEKKKSGMSWIGWIIVGMILGYVLFGAKLSERNDRLERENEQLEDLNFNLEDENFDLRMEIYDLEYYGISITIYPKLSVFLYPSKNKIGIDNK